MRDYRLYLHDIKEAIEKIETFTKGFTFEEFAEDDKTVDAVIRNLEILGEANPSPCLLFLYHSAIRRTSIP